MTDRTAKIDDNNIVDDEDDVWKTWNSMYSITGLVDLDWCKQ